MNFDLTEIEPVERRVDTLLRAETDEGPYLLVVESQRKKDEAKRGSWPYYLSYLYEKYRCEPVLIVTTQCSSTARRAAEPVHLGVPGRSALTVRPLVLGPDNVSLIADAREVERDVPLAVLSAVTHGRGPKAAAVLESLAAALKTIDADSAAAFVQFVDSCLADPQVKQMARARGRGPSCVPEGRENPCSRSGSAKGDRTALFFGQRASHQPPVRGV